MHSRVASNSPINKAGLRRNLLRWYARSARDLPWRRTADPYAIWVSEIMLQQTQVETAIPYYRRFLDRLPTVQSLARARLETVLKLWEGLGYYGRARNLHRAARVVVCDHGGTFPDTLTAWQALPGVGRYTAGAIASIAFNRPAPLVDGNVARVLARLTRMGLDPKSSAGRAALWSLAEELLAPRRPGAFNQALMELGATVCRPDQPDCPHCPLRNQCLAHRHDVVARYPLRTPGRPVPLVQVGVGVVYRGGRILIDRRPPEGLLGGLWEFPGGKRRSGEPLRQTVLREIREELGITVRVERKLMVVAHAYSHFRVRLHVFVCCYLGGRIQHLSCTAHRWVAPGQLRRFAFPTANRRILDALGV